MNFFVPPVLLFKETHVVKEMQRFNNTTFKSFKFLVNCPVGTFFNIVSKECSLCLAGSYQPDEAQVKQFFDSEEESNLNATNNKLLIERGGGLSPKQTFFWEKVYR